MQQTKKPPFTDGFLLALQQFSGKDYPPIYFFAVFILLATMAFS